MTPIREPFLTADQKLAGSTLADLRAAVRSVPGRDVLVRQCSSPGVAAVTAARYRDQLGTDFYVTRKGRKVWVRARRLGEPQVRKMKVNLGTEWVSQEQACEMLSCSRPFLRYSFERTGMLTKYRFGRRVVYRRDEVAELAKRVPPGGNWARKDQADE